ncbi:MAG: hypothetical protein QG602_2114 [Verrucomicrobiota bacterium]|nr:hypothetical protein [Verrucomicrobiota bacterium]
MVCQYAVVILNRLFSISPLPVPGFVAQIQQLKDGFGLALAVLFMFGFFWGIIKIWSGANAISKGDPDGKAGIVAGIIIAAAATIMAALFTIFGLQDAVITPRF